MGKQRMLSSQLDVDIAICNAFGNRACLEFASEVVVCCIFWDIVHENKVLANDLN